MCRNARAPRTHAVLKFPIGARYSRHGLSKPFVVYVYVHDLQYTYCVLVKNTTF